MLQPDATAAEATWLLASFEHDRQHPGLARELWLAIPPDPGLKPEPLLTGAPRFIVWGLRSFQV